MYSYLTSLQMVQPYIFPHIFQVTICPKISYFSLFLCITADVKYIAGNHGQYVTGSFPSFSLIYFSSSSWQIGGCLSFQKEADSAVPVPNVLICGPSCQSPFPVIKWFEWTPQSHMNFSPYIMFRYPACHKKLILICLKSNRIARSHFHSKPAV